MSRLPFRMSTATAIVRTSSERTELNFIEIDTRLPNMTAFRKVRDDKRNLTEPELFRTVLK